MRTGELLAAAFWLAVGLGVTAAGWQLWPLGISSPHDPGSGFMIFWVGIAMAALSVATLVAAARQPAATALSSLWRGTRWWLVPYVAVLLGLYAWLMPVLGFLATTVGLLLILFLTIDRQGWIAPPLGALLITLGAYLVFHRWLGTQLPAGEVERWLGTHLPLLFGRA